MVQDGRQRGGLEVVDGEVGGKLLKGDVDLMFMFNDKLNDFLPPADHLHLFLRVLKTDVVVDEL